MDNPVVRTVTATLQQAGYATLRFNFRGVGNSSGAYDSGVGEADDAASAVRTLIERSGATLVTLAGYSFGAMVALLAGVRISEVDRLIAVAPPLAFMDLGSLVDCRKEKLFIVGDRDAYCSVSQLRKELTRVADPKMHRIINDADHFFVGYERALADALSSTIAPAHTHS